MRQFPWLFLPFPVLLFAGLVSIGEAPKGTGPIAFKGARLLTAEGPAIDNGVLVIDRGKIVALGPAGSVTIPQDARTVDVTGKTIIPGLVTRTRTSASGPGRTCPP